MSFGVGGESLIGSPTIHISAPGTGHPPEFWAQRLVDRIMSVSDTAPQPIRDQAHTFKEAIYLNALQIIRQAMASAEGQVIHRKTGV